MPTPKTQDNSVQELIEHYKNILRRESDHSKNAILLGARRAAKGIIYPQESYEALKLYQQVTVGVLGKLDLFPGEPNLLEEEEQGKQKALPHSGRVKS